MAEFWLRPTDDDIAEGDETFEIFGRARGDVANLIASIAPASFRIIDDDTREVIFTPAAPLAVTVPEGGGRRSYTVRLGSQPVGGDVSVKMTDVARAPAAGQENRELRFFHDLAGSAKTRVESSGLFFNIGGDGLVLTFTAANWSEEQLVYVNLEYNNDKQEDSEATVEHVATGGGYDNVEVPGVLLKLTEFGFVLTSSTFSAVFEGHTIEYGISLRSQPEDTVTMRVMLPPNPGITLRANKAELIFSTENWNTLSL